MNRRLTLRHAPDWLLRWSRMVTIGALAWLAFAATSVGQAVSQTPLPRPGDGRTPFVPAPSPGSKIDASHSPRRSELSLADLPAEAKRRLWGPNQPRELKWVVSGLLAMSGMWLALQLLRSGRRAPGELSEDVLEFLGSIPVDPRHRLLLVRLGSQVLLLSQSEGQLQTLAAISDPGEVQAMLVTCRHGAGGPSPAWAVRGATLSREVRRRINELS